MKHFLFYIAFALLSTHCIAQETSFSASAGKLVWENVFISTEVNIPNLIAKHSRLKITSGNGTFFKGVGTAVKNTCQGTSSILKDSYSFDFEIQLTDGKYRVTITNLVFLKGKKGKQEQVKAEGLFINKDAVAGSTQAQTDLSCIDAYLNKLFSMTNMYKSKS